MLAAFLLFTLPAVAGETITGTASVVDGDTLDIQGRRVRLHGIDAPESAQLCQDGAGKDWRCGQQAALALSDRIARRPVTCEAKDQDRYGRIVGACQVAGENLNAWMVSQGWAMAYRQYSSDYVSAEATAKAASAGIWRGTFQPPWDWRKEARNGGKQRTANQNAPAAMPTGCQIKGNMSAEGERIYHVPGGRFYDRTQINAGRGERWFCSETEAEAAGWRRADQ